MRRPVRRGLGVGLVMATVFTAPAIANAGDVDLGFGVGGKVSTDYQRDFEEGRGLAIQNDGRVVVAGETVLAGTGRDFAVVRYASNGSLDPSFGYGGRVSTDFGGDFDIAFDVALQADGKIISAGTSGQIDDDASFDFALARYNPDGSLDHSFSGDGKVTTDFAGDDDEVAAVAVQQDGRIVVAGFAGPAGDFTLARYTTDGSLDPSFGSGGKVLTDFPGTDGGADALAIRPDGKILVAGERTDPVTDGDFALMRYTANGSIDPTFGTGGLVTTDFGGAYDEAYGMVIQRDGRIVLVGGRDLVDNTSGDFALARYTADGLLDSTFGNGGKVSTGLTAGEDVAYAVTLQLDGRIVVAGAADFALNVHGDFAVARYITNGVLDATFSGDGKVTTDFAYGFDNVFDVAIQSDGKIMTTGEVTNPRTSRDIGLVRYLAS